MTRPLIIIVLAATLLTVTIATGHPAPAVDLLSNGGFEWGDWEWRSVWGHRGHRVVSDVKHSGDHSMLFDRMGSIKSPAFEYHGGPIEVSGWYRLEDVVTGEAHYHNWWLTVNFLDSEGEGIKHRSVLSVDGTCPWTKFSNTVSAPEGTASIELSLSLHNTTGTAWVDDLQVRADAGLSITPDGATEQPHYTREILPQAHEVQYGESVPIWDVDENRARIRVHLGDNPCRGAQFGKERIDFRLVKCSRYIRFSRPELPDPTLVVVYLGHTDSPHIRQAAGRMNIELADLPAQGHIVRMQGDDVVRVLAAGADDKGVAYAAASLVQMIGYEDETLVLRRFNLTDWPNFLRRASSDYGPVSANFLARMVGYKMSMYAIQHRSWWELVEPDRMKGRSGTWRQRLEAMDEFRTSTGAIDLMMLVHIYVSGGRPPEMTGPVFDIAGEEHIQKLIEKLRWLYEMGIHTQMICVDDYTDRRNGEWDFKTQAERERFDSIGQAHGYLMGRLWEALEPECPHLRLSIVGAPYSTRHLSGRGVSRESGLEYLGDLAEAMPDEVAVVWTGPRVISPTITEEDWREYESFIPGQALYIWDNNQGRNIIADYDVDYYPGIEEDSAWSLMYQNAHFVGWPHTTAAALSANDYMWDVQDYDADEIHERACHNAWGELDYADVKLINETFPKAKELMGNPAKNKEELLTMVGRIYDAVERLQKAGVPMRVPKRHMASNGIAPDMPDRLESIPHATVPSIETDITLDGKLTEAAWDQAVALGPLVPNSGEEPGEDFYETMVRLFCGGDALYVAYECHHEGTELFEHENVGKKDANIFFNSDTAEIFLGPEIGRGTYAHIVADHTNTHFDEMRGNGGGSWDADWQAVVDKKKGVWTIEFRLPYAELGVEPPERGDVAIANFCRSFGQKGQLSCWSPTYGSFHNWPFFGRLVFE